MSNKLACEAKEFWAISNNNIGLNTHTLLIWQCCLLILILGFPPLRCGRAFRYSFRCAAFKPAFRCAAGRQHLQSLSRAILYKSSNWQFVYSFPGHNYCFSSSAFSSTTISFQPACSVINRINSSTCLPCFSADSIREETCA